MDYKAIGDALTTIGKEITKANNKLDQVLEKLVEFENLEEQKKSAIAAIEGDNFSEALELVKTLDKGKQKRLDLLQQEEEIRKTLESLRESAQATAEGNIPDSLGTQD